FWLHKARVGAPSLVHDIHDAGYLVSERTISRILNRLGLRSKAARQFTPDNPDRVWVTDITYIKTGEGWLYLCVMIDLFSRKVIGWHTGSRINRHLVCQSLNNALLRRGYPKGVLVHSDRGSQYCSDDFKQLLLYHDLRQSMSRKGNCWDNAVAESFF